MKKVMVFGTFDILHKGHVHMFRQAGKHGDVLIAVIARDSTVKKIKKKLPRLSETKRLAQIKPYVNKAVLGSKSDKYKIIEKFNPDVIALGYDQNSFTKDLRKELKKRRLNPKIVRLKSYMPKKYKSSKLKR